MKVDLYSDGGMSPMPNFGYVVRDDAGLIVHQEGKQLPEGVTSNEAEWCGLMAALYKARELGATHVVAHGDSQLVMRQASGQYAVRAENLISFHEELLRVVEHFDTIQFRWVPRDKNKLADELGRQACE